MSRYSSKCIQHKHRERTKDNGGVMSIGSNVENPLLTLTASSSSLRSSQDDYDESDIDNKNNNDSGDDYNEDHRKMELEVSSSCSLPLFRLTIKNSCGRAAADTNTTLLFVMLQPKLFWKKIASVFTFIASCALLPLMLYKSKLPVSIYTIILIVIHVGVLIIYCCKVQFNQLDFDRISFGSRILALFVTIWLLPDVSNLQDHTHIGIFTLQMLELCLILSFLLSLFMVAVLREAVKVEEETDDDTEHLTTNTDDTQMLC